MDKSGQTWYGVDKMLDANRERLVRLRYANAKIPGGPHSVDTIRKWAKRGIRGVRLETARVGGTIYTSEEAIGRFILKLNQEDQLRS